MIKAANLSCNSSVLTMHNESRYEASQNNTSFISNPTSRFIFRCSVWCYDGMGRDDFMGERIIPIGDVKCSDVIYADWYDLKPEVSFS